MEVAGLRAENEKLKDTSKAAEETKKTAEARLKELELELKKLKGQTKGVIIEIFSKIYIIVYYYLEL